MATSDLTKFGLHKFHSLDEITFLQPQYIAPNQKEYIKSYYNTSYISRNSYIIIKNDCISGKYKTWMNNEHMNLTFHWFKQNVESPTSNSFLVVQSDFVKITSDFYQNLMNGEVNINAVQRAFDIH